MKCCDIPEKREIREAGGERYIKIIQLKALFNTKIGLRYPRSILLKNQRVLPETKLYPHKCSNVDYEDQIDKLRENVKESRLILTKKYLSLDPIKVTVYSEV